MMTPPCNAGGRGTGVDAGSAAGTAGRGLAAGASAGDGEARAGPGRVDREVLGLHGAKNRGPQVYPRWSILTLKGVDCHLQRPTPPRS